MGTQTRSVDRAKRGAWGYLWVGVVALVIAAACTPPGSPDSMSLTQLKRSHYGQQAQGDAARIAAGTQQPVVEFTVESTPPSVFINWIVPDAGAGAFESAIGLPPGFSLAKVRILESDPVPRYWLSLNVYKVSGITTGRRAEWSTYVDDGTGTPRFMIIRARAAEGSLDPIGPLALPEPFSHTLGGDEVIRTAMKRTELQGGIPVLTSEDLFTSSIQLPAEAQRNYVTPTTQWVAANDYIYWINGVKDRVFQNSTAHSAPMISVDLNDVQFDDATEWAPLVDPVPAHVLVYLDKLEFAIGPWWNVTEPDGNVPPATQAVLSPLKKSMYSNLENIHALSVLSGSEEPSELSTVADTPPSVRWHWRIPAEKLGDFTAAANLPSGLTLAQTTLQDDDTQPDYWLTLNAYRVDGISTGVRAEWSTYVDDGNGVRNLILEARADHRALDPVNRFTDPYPVTHTFDNVSVATTVGPDPSGLAAFSSSFVVPPSGSATTVQASREWVTANELRYWTNGVADRVAHDSTVFYPKISVNPATVSVTDTGQWSEFTANGPDRVWVDEQGVGLVTNPWWNL